MTAERCIYNIYVLTSKQASSQVNKKYPRRPLIIYSVLRPERRIGSRSSTWRKEVYEDEKERRREKHLDNLRRVILEDHSIAALASFRRSSRDDTSNAAVTKPSASAPLQNHS